MTEWNTWTYTPKTEEELNALIQNVVKGKIFTSDHLAPGDEKRLPEVFNLLTKWDSPEFRKAIHRENIEMMFADRKTGERVEGLPYPRFSVCGFLSKTEAETLRQRVRHLYAVKVGKLEDKRKQFNERESNGTTVDEAVD